MKKHPEIALSIGGYDCTGTGDWTALELRQIAEVLQYAAAAIEERRHGYVELKDLVHVGIDFGGPFDDDTGLPKIKIFRPFVPK